MNTAAAAASAGVNRTTAGRSADPWGHGGPHTGQGAGVDFVSRATVTAGCDDGGGRYTLWRNGRRRCDPD